MRRILSVAFLIGLSVWLLAGAVWAQGDNDQREFYGKVQSVTRDPDTITLWVHDQGAMTLSVDHDRLDEDARHRWHHLQPGDHVKLTAHYSQHRNAWRVTDIDMHHDDDHHHGY